MMEKLINKIFILVEGEEELTNAPVVAKDDGNCALSKKSIFSHVTSRDS